MQPVTVGILTLCKAALPYVINGCRHKNAEGKFRH